MRVAEGTTAGCSPRGQRDGQINRFIPPLKRVSPLVLCVNARARVRVHTRVYDPNEFVVRFIIDVEMANGVARSCNASALADR